MQVRTNQARPWITFITLSGLLLGFVSAQDYSALYQVRLSERDHYSSSGVKLTSVAAILRQDRANYHKFNKRDAEDQSDRFFSSVGNRGLLEGYYNNVANNSPLSKADRNVIINGTPLVKVSLVDGVGTKYLRVKILDRAAGAGDARRGGGNIGGLQKPKPGNPLRKAVLDGLRSTIQNDLGQKVIFIVGDIRVVEDWAYVQVTPVQTNSKPIDFTKTRYKEVIDKGAFDGPTTYALLRKQGEQWVTITFQVGPTDVCWIGWSEAPYNAPGRVLPSGGD